MEKEPFAPTALASSSWNDSEDVIPLARPLHLHRENQITSKALNRLGGCPENSGSDAGEFATRGFRRCQRKGAEAVTQSPPKLGLDLSLTTVSSRFDISPFRRSSVPTLKTLCRNKSAARMPRNSEFNLKLSDKVVDKGLPNQRY
ncbi:hypothetical protein CB1_000245028 [Camelus ferus]|nr:hypothetical protein CB1_000245028 [Camelus ferus]